MKNFTFKTEHPTGRWRSFEHDTHIIKYNQIEVGRINHAEPFTICLMVIKEDINSDGNPNCKWKWIRLKKESKSLQEAKDFLKENCEKILSIYNLVTKEE